MTFPARPNTWRIFLAAYTADEQIEDHQALSWTRSYSRNRSTDIPVRWTRIQ